MFWRQGWDVAPELVRRCLRSWEYHNPGWTIRALDAETLPAYVDLSDFSAASERDFTVQTLSDLLRLGLMSTHGGVWADADRHFLSQHRQMGLADGRLPDFVGRHENLDEDWQRLAAHLGLPATPLPLMNTMAGWRADADALKTARLAAMEAHMTERSKTLLRTRYAEDFRLLGYSPD